MAAVPIHIVRTGIQPVDQLGNVVSKDNATIAQMMRTSGEHRVIADATVPNSANSPSIPTYLTLEAADGYVLYHLDQTMVVTYAITPVQLN